MKSKDVPTEGPALATTKASSVVMVNTGEEPAPVGEHHRHRTRCARGAGRARRHGHGDAEDQARVRSGRARDPRHRFLMALVLLLGGARSGKSAMAVQLAADSQAPVTFIAT